MFGKLSQNFVTTLVVVVVRINFGALGREGKSHLRIFLLFHFLADLKHIVGALPEEARRRWLFLKSFCWHRFIVLFNLDVMVIAGSLCSHSSAFDLRSIDVG